MWREAVERDQLITDEGYARGCGREVGEYRAAAAEQVHALLVDAEIRIRLWPGDLAGWLTTGEFETMHGAGKSSGDPHLEDRLKVEEAVLGVERGTPEAARPRYGYASGSIEGFRALNDYGKVVVRLEDQVRSRATVLLGDSIGSTNTAGWSSLAPESFGSPGLLCRFSNQDVLDAADLGAACDQTFRYAEVQVYGPLRPEHIAEIVFCGGEIATDELRRLALDRSLPVTEIEGYLP